uniref:Regulator of chromosome condensation n=1 Tax=Meloidogyne incognita TaxID=6306 RepID=A0A914MV86_MELIC
MGTPARHGKKRKTSATPVKSAPSSARKARKVFEQLSIDQFVPKQVGTRVLSCGEGEQLGHPGRNVTRKPRAIDTFDDGTKFVQVAAGGVHSLLLTTEGAVFSCGINEKGTVPVHGLEAEGSTDRFSEIVFSPEIKRLGKIVQVTAGASFSAALTEKGSVIAWGNLRDTQGEVNVHEMLKDIQKKPVVVIRHKSRQKWHIVKIAAGENHLAMLSTDGELLTFGEGSMGQLGRSTRTEHIRSKFMVDQSGTSLILRVLEKHQFIRFVNVWANGFWTIARAEDGRLFACGLNNFGQLGVTATPANEKKTGRSRGRRSDSDQQRKEKNRDQQGADTSTTNSFKQSSESMEISLNQLNVSSTNQNSSEDSSQDPETDEKTDGEMKPQKNEDDSNNEKKEELKNGDENGNVPEQKEVNKVALLTWAQAFQPEHVWSHVSGVQHIVCRNEDDNALGIGTWEGNQDDQHWRYDTLQRITLPENVRAAGIDATLGASIFWTDDGNVYGFGCDTVGQLGLGIKDDDEKVVPTPRKIHSAHLDNFRVISVSLADNHALFLAEPNVTDASTSLPQVAAAPALINTYC